MGNRKKLKEAQKLFYEMGLGRIYPRWFNKRLRHNHRDFYKVEIQLLYELWCGKTVYNHMCCNGHACNSFITKIGRNERHSYLARFGGTPGVAHERAVPGQPYVHLPISGRYWVKNLEPAKTRDELESSFVKFWSENFAVRNKNGRSVERGMMEIIMAGGHIFDERGVYLPEFNLKRVLR